MNHYPSFRQIQDTASIGNLGMQIVMDTYSKSIHEKCKKLHDAVVRKNGKIELSEEELTNIVYIEIVLSLSKDWSELACKFRNARDRQRDQRAASLSTVV